ncbi:0878aea9-5a2e-44aa-b6e2-e721acf10245 [Sclerotinia trifoliorum]|uniref:0878aea9-5a2e-44aa-b6e2-e721acf10245 n=1 Tax=Sclerotinia trifoliorum TaxID=28548 RepID=A0A8H2VTI5_9HELO|nr:0878aea9-5a2e-44aa-b6e2-e721acf10245 [Sclerotinia trifoliorum]
MYFLERTAVSLPFTIRVTARGKMAIKVMPRTYYLFISISALQPLKFFQAIQFPINMSQANGPVCTCRKFGKPLLQLQHTSLYSEYPQSRQDTFNEDSSSHSIPASPICKSRFRYHSELARGLDYAGCFTQQRCTCGSDNEDMREHEEDGVEEVQVLSFTSPEISRMSINLDIGLKYMDFELYGSQFEECESYHDVCITAPTSSDSSKVVGLDDYNSSDACDTPRSSEMTLAQGDFCLPPPNSPTSSWNMSDRSIISLPTVYPGDYFEAWDPDELSGVGEWMCGTMSKQDDLGGEIELYRNKDENTAPQSSLEIGQALDTFAISFYGV